MTFEILSTLTLIGAVGFACQWLSWRLGLPAILFLLVSGIVLGPVLHIVDTDALFGEILFPFVSLAVAIILFEGSMTLKKRELKEVGATVSKLVTVGAVINGVITTLATHYLVKFDWGMSALFGAVMVVTGPTVIGPILRTVKPSTRLSKVLRWEGIVIDPLGALFAVIVFEWISLSLSNAGANTSSLFYIFGKTIVVGTVIGAVTGHIFGLLIKHFWIPEYLHNFAAIAFVAFAFAGSDAISHESGLLAVTVMGIWIANMPGVHIRHILDFKESLTVIFVSILFILLAARINFSALITLGWGALGVLLVMMFIARPVKVFLCTLKTDLTPKEKIFLSWIGPRGIVAAAVSALFALKLEQLGYPQAELIVPLTFTVIVGTVLVVSLTASPLAKILGVSQSDAAGFLIIGANPVAITIAKALQEAGAHVRLCDSYYDNIKRARMENLLTYYGNPMSSHAEMYMEMSVFTGMLGLSMHSERNTAAALRFREEFGVRNVFTLASPEDSKENDKYKSDHVYRGRVLFGKEATYSRLVSIINSGYKLGQTVLSDEFSYSHWQEHNTDKNIVILFAKDTNGKFRIPVQGEDFNPKSGWTIYTMLQVKEKEVAQQKADSRKEDEKLRKDSDDESDDAVPA